MKRVRFTVYDVWQYIVPNACSSQISVVSVDVKSFNRSKR